MLTVLQCSSGKQEFVPWEGVLDPNLNIGVEKKMHRFEKFGKIEIPEAHPLGRCDSICQYCNMALFQEDKILLCCSKDSDIKQEIVQIR